MLLKLIEPYGNINFNSINDNTISARYYIDLNGSYNLTQNFDLFAKVNNLLDKDPPIVSNVVTGTGQPNSFPTYDLLGRVIFANFTLKF